MAVAYNRPDMPGPDETIPRIAARLRATRQALGLTQSELCLRAGIARNTYNQWEKAGGRPQLDEAKKLCRTFELTLDWIYFGDARKLPYELAAKIDFDILTGQD